MRDEGEHKGESEAVGLGASRCRDAEGVSDGFEVTRVDDLAKVPVAHGLEWRPIGRRFGIRAFGINAYTAEKPGDWVVEEHTESSGQEEVYIVLSGRAAFTVGGEEIDGPAGTILFIRDHTLKRVARSEEEGTTVLAVGGWPDKQFEPSSWEWFFEAYQQQPEQGIATMEDGIRVLGERPELLYHLACMEAKAGRRDDAAAHLAQAIELRPELREQAAADDDLSGLPAA
jgi:mannose-6-phosphate isomerase-like protein (cupin superfamily)